jgi:hypothetical protein
MSSIARKFFKASLVYFILGLVAQVVAGFDLWLGFNPLAYTAIVAIEKILFLGWLTQLSLALVYDRWLQPPRPLAAPLSKIELVLFTLFNLGLPLVILGQPGLAMLAGAWVGPLAALGSLLQLLAGLIFLRQAWVWLRRERGGRMKDEG